MNKMNYEYEHYNLFRLELSEYLVKNEIVKNKMSSLLDNVKLEKKELKKKLAEIMVQIMNVKTDFVYNVKFLPNTD